MIYLIILETPHKKILITKKYLINVFCRIYNIQKKFGNRPIYRKYFSLLKSPHIHKKTWRKYLKQTHMLACLFDIPNIKHYYKLYLLLQKLSTNSHITIRKFHKLKL